MIKKNIPPASVVYLTKLSLKMAGEEKGLGICVSSVVNLFAKIIPIKRLLLELPNWPLSM